MGSDVWMRIARIAGAQHGVIAVEQLYACGLSKDGVWRSVQVGHLHRLHRGVYAVGHTGAGSLSRWKGATIAAGDGAYLSHRASAEAHSMLKEAGRRIIDVTVRSRNGRRRRRGLRIHRIDAFRPDETCRVAGILCTSPARTIIDLAGSEPRRVLERAVRSGESTGHVKADAVGRILARHPLAPGHALIVELLRLRDPVAGKSDSDLELIFFDLCARLGVRLPEVNAKIDANGARYRVDFAWPELRLAIETDGRKWHSGEFATSRDETRDRDLTIAGWRVQRLTWRQIILDPQGAAAIVRSLIEQQQVALAAAA